jgi:hypothetical protein
VLIALLGSVLGLAFVSGLRLYSTVLALGLGIRFGLLTVPPHLANLTVLSHTPILVLAGVLYLVEFVADKVPWVDSAWDTVHTLIRPVGAAALAATAMVDMDPSVEALLILLAGGVALSGHAAKAGTRLAVNHSPEPVSNIGLSLSEDGLVVAGIWLALSHPVVALVLVLLALAAIAWLLPKLFRLIRGSVARIRAGLRRLAGASPPPPSSSSR